MMRTSHEAKQIEVEKLKAGGNPYQIRVAMDEDTIERYADFYREGGRGALPALAVTIKNDGTIIVIDGHHRLEAAIRAGLKELNCESQYFDNGVSDTKNCTLEALRANATHGLALSRADRMNAARRLIDACPHMPLRQVADEVGLSKSTIGNLKKEQNSLSKMDKTEEVETPDPDAGGLPPEAQMESEIRCDMCGMKGRESELTDPEKGWIRVAGKLFCCPLCRSAFEGRAQESALETAGTEYLATFGDEPEGFDEECEIEEPEDVDSRDQVESEPTRVEHKRCPFCGYKASAEKVLKIGFRVLCSNRDCHIIPQTDVYETEAEAWEIWDTRAEQ